MPYEYRKLSPTERKIVVELRKQRGYPLHAPPHPYREAGTFLITAANYEHAAIIETPKRRSEFQEILLAGFAEIQAEVIGWVILRNHYHILASVESLNLVSSAIQHIHGVTSHVWNQEDGLTGKRKVWYKFSDRLMRNEKLLFQTLNYIHYNPIKHGLAEDAFVWPWSSLFLYTDEKGKEWFQNCWDKFKPPDNFGKIWD
jgi:putative transposase